MLEPSCPWTSFAPSTSQFCEAAVCGLVREPANTWSNVGFVLAGAAILRLGPARAVAPRLIRRFGWVLIGLGLGSAVFHATRTYLGGVLDTAGMQAAAAFMLAANLRRLLPRIDAISGERRDARVFWSIAALGTALAITFESYERTLYAVEMIAASVMELAILRRDRVRRAHAWLALSWAAFVPAYALWWLDLRGIACRPSSHVMNGHAAWHLLMAACLFFVQRFHAELVTSDLRRPEMRDGSASRGRARCRA